MKKINQIWFIFLYNYYDMKRYIGNKEKILSTIESFIDDNKINVKSFVDLYAGTGSVSEYFRSKYIVHANDIMHYSFVVLKAKLSFKTVPEFKKFIEIFKHDPIDELNKLEKPKGKAIIYNNFSPVANRKYFTEENSLIIDAARQEIDLWKKDELISEEEWYYLLACIITAVNSKGNTTGTFGAFLKEFSNSSIKRIEFKHLEIKIGKKGKVYSQDGKKLISKIKADIAYLDPPYTAIDYSQAYHLLESLSIYDETEYKGITGRRINNEKVSRYTKKNSALEEFDETLMNAIKIENVLLSYSSHGIIEEKDIVKVMKKYYEEVVILRIPYKKYRNVYKNEKGKLEELLFLGKRRKNETNS